MKVEGPGFIQKRERQCRKDQGWGLWGGVSGKAETHSGPAGPGILGHQLLPF